MSGLDRTYENVALQKKLEGILFDGLAPIVEQLFRKKLGADWLVEINRRRSLTPKRQDDDSVFLDPIGSNQGSPRWDSNLLLHTIRENLADLEGMYKGNADNIQSYCQDLKSIRNSLSHVTGDALKRAATDRRVLFYGELVSKILWSFSVPYKKRRELDDLVDSIFGSVRKEQQEQSVNIPVQSAPPQQAATVETPAKDVFDILGEVEPPKREMDLPEPGPGVACFLMADHRINPPSDNRECVGSIVTTVYSSGAGPSRAIPTGLGSDASNDFHRIIADVRSHERQTPRLDVSTRSTFDPLAFVGTSHGLALAVSDRTARCEMCPSYKDRRIVATGIVVKSRGGVVGAVTGFSQKLDIAAAFMPAGTLFLFAAANLSADDDGYGQKLKILKEAGIEARPINHVNELDFLLIDGPAEEITPLQTAIATTDATIASKGSHEIGTPRRRIINHILAAFIFGLAVLGAIYIYGVLDKDDPEQLAFERQSSARLSNLASAGERLAAEPIDPDACSNANQAASSLTEFDKARLEPRHNQTIDAARVCALAAKKLEANLAALVVAARAYDGKSLRVVRNMVEARSKIETIKLSTELTPEQASAMKTGDQATDKMKLSSDRAAAFGTAYLEWTRNRDDLEAVKGVIAAYNAMDSLTVEIASETQSSELRTVADLSRNVDRMKRSVAEAVTAIGSLGDQTSITRRRSVEQLLQRIDASAMSVATVQQKAVLDEGAKKLSAARWETFVSAANVADKSDDPAEISVALSSYADLTDDDKRAHADALKQKGRIVDALLTQSTERDGRLARLEAAAERVGQPGIAGRDLLVATVELAEATKALSPSDMNGASEVRVAAFSGGRAALQMLETSESRISKLGQLARLAKSASGETVSSKVKAQMTQARNALTPFDRATLTDEQRQWIVDVCLAKVRPKPGFFAANPALECKDDPDFAEMQGR